MRKEMGDITFPEDIKGIIREYCKQALYTQIW